MEPRFNHSWELSITEAVELQHKLAVRVISIDQLDIVEYIAGVDVAYDVPSDTIVAAAVILNAHDNAVVETSLAIGKASFPYESGLFAFRELPILIEAIRKLRIKPDLIVCDGQGFAHPRRFGLACHIGILYDIPTIGCAKNILLGEHKPLSDERGSSQDITDNDEVIGLTLRTQTNVKPIYVSIGHRISLATAADWVLRLAPKYRLPETTRQSDHAVKMALKELRI